MWWCSPYDSVIADKIQQLHFESYTNEWILIKNRYQRGETYKNIIGI